MQLYSELFDRRKRQLFFAGFSEADAERLAREELEFRQHNMDQPLQKDGKTTK